MNYAVCSCEISAEIENNLSKLGVLPVKLRGFDKFGKFHPLSYHPDMLCFKAEKNKWIFYEEIYKKNSETIDKLNIGIITEKDPESCEYPNDIALNAAMFGDYLICNTQYTSKKILEYAKNSGKKIIGVKQGYAKCSVCVTGKNSIITSDRSVCREAQKNGIEVLFISKGHIGLNGYNYGFIGGASGLIDEHTLVFTGNIRLHPDYYNIKNFCENRDVEIISISKENLYDYGSILCCY